MKWILAVTLAVSGCTGDDSTGDDGSSIGVNCGLLISIDADAAQRTMTGTGGVMCSDDATIEIETCVQVAEPGSSDFTDLHCESQTATTAVTRVIDLANCAAGTDKSYRAKMTSVINGIERPEQLSDTISCE
ncbi:MAG TPA: hypothetical protein VGM90_11675 [Kofleriaceae bacterium]